MDDIKWSEVKPDDNMLSETAPWETLFIKPRDTISKQSIGKAVHIKPCDTISDSLAKKRRVDSVEVDKMDWEEELEEVSAIKVTVGERLNVKDLLSSKDRDYLVSPKDGKTVSISTLYGKYVLLCGFPVPIPDGLLSDVACNCNAIQALFSELLTRGIADDVVLIIVVKLALGFTDADVRTFFSRFPLPHFVVNPSGIVLQRSFDLLSKYGALSFPFTNDHFEITNLSDKLLKHQLCFTYEPTGVDVLFQCGQMLEIGNEMNSKSTRRLGNAPVGVYLYFDGKFMDKLQDIHKKCVEKGRKFEIVLVPLPFHSEFDPASFCDHMKQHALKCSTSSSWLAFPFDDKICRTLWRIFKCCEEDQLIIMQHGNCPGELFGKQVASHYGIEAYPFSRNVVVERKMSELW